MDLKELTLRIKGDSSSAESALSKVGAGANKFGGIVKTVIAGAAVAAVVAFGKSCINAAAESQSAEALLRSSLGNIKGMTDANKQAAVDWVNAMEQSKSFDDADLGAALQRLTLKTGSLKEGQDAVNVSMEVARNKHISLEAATTLMDAAYNGATKTLKLFGIEVGPDGKPLKGMEALNAIQQKVKGSGDAWAQTLEGQRAQFQTTFGNFQESVGGFLMPIATKFMEVIQPFLQKGMSWIADHLPQIQAVIDTLVKGIAWVVETAGKMYEAIKPFIVSITETLGPYVRELFTWLGEHGINLQSVLVGVATAIGTAWTIVAAIYKGIIDSITWIIQHAQEAIAWVKGVGANTGVNQGGVYTPPAPVKPPVTLVKTSAASNAANLAAAKALATQSLRGHAEGGMVGLNGPEVGLLGEKGPEYVTSNKDLGGNDALLRKLIDRMDTLISIESRAPAMFGSVVNGLGRGA